MRNSKLIIKQNTFSLIILTPFIVFTVFFSLFITYVISLELIQIIIDANLISIKLKGISFLGIFITILWSIFIVLPLSIWRSFFIKKIIFDCNNKTISIKSKFGKKKIKNAKIKLIFPHKTLQETIYYVYIKKYGLFILFGNYTENIQAMFQYRQNNF